MYEDEAGGIPDKIRNKGKILGHCNYTSWMHFIVNRIKGMKSPVLETVVTTGTKPIWNPSIIDKELMAKHMARFYNDVNNKTGCQERAMTKKVINSSKSYRGNDKIIFVGLYNLYLIILFVYKNQAILQTILEVEDLSSAASKCTASKCAKSLDERERVPARIDE